MRREAGNFTLTTVFPQELNTEVTRICKGRPTSKRGQYSYTRAMRQLVTQNSYRTALARQRDDTPHG